MERIQSSSNLLCSLYQRDVKVWIEKEILRFRAPMGSISQEEVEGLRVYKPEIIEQLKHMDFSMDARVYARASGNAVPLTPMQLLGWNYMAQRSNRSVRWSHAGVRVVGQLEVSLLKRSVDAIVWRHEALRGRVAIVDGVPHLKFDDVCEYDWNVIDISHVARNIVERELMTHVENFVKEEITLTSGGLFAIRVFKISDFEHLVIFALDHFISDGVSVGILIKEVWNLYGQALVGREFCLPKPSLQFGDYALWLRWTHGAWLHKHDQYWRQKLTGAPSPEIPTCPVLEGKAIGARLSFSIEGELSLRLRDIARRQCVALSLVILTVYIALMSRWCDQRDLLVRVSSNGRCRPEFNQIVGFLANPLFLRVEIVKDDTFLDLLLRTKLEFCSAIEHVTFGWIFDSLPGLRSDAFFDWLPPLEARSVISPRPDKEIKVMPVPQPVTIPVKFLPLFHDDGAKVNVSVDYLRDSSMRSAVQWFADNLQLLARAFALDPYCKVETVSIASPVTSKISNCAQSSVG